MRKYIKWPIIAAVLSAAIVKDPCFGPFIGLITGCIVGVPVYWLVAGLLGLLVRGNKKIPQLIAVWSSILLVVVLHWFLFRPPAWLLFSTRLAYPIPASVTHLESKTSLAIFDGSYYMVFAISNDDLERIIQNKGFEAAQKYEFSHDMENRWLELSSSKGSSTFCFSDAFSWFGRIKEMPNAKVYLKDNIRDYSGTYEYIVFDPNDNMAYYECMSM